MYGIYPDWVKAWINKIGGLTMDIKILDKNIPVNNGVTKC
jgi:hypothetical protein